MPTKVEKDEVTGTQTTGHEWDGIKELNTPLPKWWLYVFYATVVWSLVYVVLYPAIPIPFANDATDGILGYSQREVIREEMAEARQAQSQYLDRIAEADLATVRGESDLLNFALAGGEAAFLDNCAPCHGSGGSGNPGYPILADDAWLWGGSLEAIYTTLEHGIRWDEDEETRFSQMPAFGPILEAQQITEVSHYVLSLSEQEHDAAMAEAGQSLYAEQCAACHMEDGSGMTALGAPALNDQVWLYAGSLAEIERQLYDPRHGVMPAWGGRLEDTTLKMLTVYVHSLGGGE